MRQVLKIASNMNIICFTYINHGRFFPPHKNKLNKMLLKHRGFFELPTLQIAKLHILVLEITTIIKAEGKR